MVRLHILAGSQAEGFHAVRRFPFHVGRAPDNDLCLDAPGVWDYHFRLELQPPAGFTLQTCDAALAAVNDQPQTAARLRNGDVISCGSAKIQFWLAAPVQRSLRLRELLVWALWLLTTLGQIAIMSYLLGLG